MVYFAGYKKGEDRFKQDDIEVATDQAIWCTDTGAEIAPRRPMGYNRRQRDANPRKEGST